MDDIFEGKTDNILLDFDGLLLVNAKWEPNS